jgi:hypothetical protein
VKQRERERREREGEGEKERERERGLHVIKNKETAAALSNSADRP